MFCILNYKKILVIIGAILLGCGIIIQGNKHSAAATGGKTSVDSDYQQLLVRTYLPDMKAASDNFYKEYFTIAPTIVDYGTHIKDITKQNGLSEVTFISNPYIGPHDSVGADEITFTVNQWGDRKLEKFNHIISYALPENLSDLSIKLIPGQYG